MTEAGLGLCAELRVGGSLTPLFERPPPAQLMLGGGAAARRSREGEGRERRRLPSGQVLALGGG